MIKAGYEFLRAYEEGIVQQSSMIANERAYKLLCECALEKKITPTAMNYVLARILREAMEVHFKEELK